MVYMLVLRKLGFKENAEQAILISFLKRNPSKCQFLIFQRTFKTPSRKLQTGQSYHCNVTNFLSFKLINLV